MQLSVFELFRIGIGPSSSHTVGPMRAARRFIERLSSQGSLQRIARLRCELFGSLALTGRGHGTDKAIILGFIGERPDTVDPDRVAALVDDVRSTRRVSVLGCHGAAYHEADDLLFRRDTSLPEHPNGMRFSARDVDGSVIASEDFYSVGGGFVVSAEEAAAGETGGEPPARPIPYPFVSAGQLLSIAEETQHDIAGIVRANEGAWRSAEEIDGGLDRIWEAMEACIDRGCAVDGILPGGLAVKRRAAALFRNLRHRDIATDPLALLDWVSLFALAVNEENAAGGRVVTAPTNGAAGVMPAVLAYYSRFVPGANRDGIRRFLLTAGAIGMLYKQNASLSAAEMGCQGEVGVACSMAAAGLAAVLGGSNAQIENAAEIGMEHNLGLTCDPVAGLVQVPCIERNTMGATKALNAARLAVFHGDGTHFVPLDQVIETMRQTGHDMQDKYKETSQGGLSVNVIDC